jgi:U3 small nucleolar RNA-associated protein 20
MTFFYFMLYLTISFSIETGKIQGHVLQKRLNCFLSTFSAIEGPKQLVHHKLLENIFRSFLSHPDVTIVGYSISCLMKFKLDYLTPYNRHLREMIQKGKLRSSLINLSEIIEDGKMKNEDRKLMLPILARILFGRVTAKSGKSSNDSPASRRVAVLSFMSVICKEEEDYFPFLYLMTRCFIPQTEKLKLLESYEPDDRSHIIDTLMTTRSVDMALLPSPVIEGFLHLLQSVLSQFGHHVISWIPQLTAITVELFKFVKVTNETLSIKSLDTKNDGEEKKGNVHSIRRSSIRTLCFQRLCDIFSLFGSSLDFTSIAETMWSAIQPSLNLLPEMVIRNDGCPAILTLLQTMSADANLIKLLYLHDQSVHAVVKCISATSKTSVTQASLTFIENLLSVTDNDSVVIGKDLVCKFTPLLMEQFTMRLEGKEVDDAAATTGKSYPKKLGKNSPTWRRELQILFRICELFSFDDWEIKTNEISFLETLCNLLLPVLEPNNGTLNEDKMNVIGILNEIIPKLEPEVALSVFWRLSSVLAPNKSRVGIEILPIRCTIAALIDKAAAKSPKLKIVSAIVVNLSSVHKTRVDEIDFERVIPELLSFAELEKNGGTWNDICARSGSNPKFLNPIINVCFHFLHNDDGVISRASFNGLKALVFAASSSIREADENAKAWIKMVESVLLPLSRSGLQCKDAKTRRYYILLIRELSRDFHDISSANLCGDLATICNDENHDLDFFLGITHVQIHRRARAFQRLRKTLSQIDSDESKSKISSQSLSSVLLPIALHPVYECKMRSEEGFVLDSIATLGAIARHLPWNKYNNLLWVILNQFDRHPEQERYSVAALCSIIDGFNFELTKKNETESGPSQIKTSVWSSLENRILPKLEGLLSKETTSKNGDRGKTIRPAIVLALVKLFQKFPQEFFDKKLPRILAIICDALRNKDSVARDVARNTLAKMVCSIDLKYLGDVIREVAITLNEGYKLHVRSATIHTILLQLLAVYEPPPKENVEKVSVPFDDCTAAIMELIQDDLFGVANERRESRDTNVRFIKEAGGNKSVHSIEMLCRMISFAPSKASSGNQSRSAVHCIISPLLERLRLPDIDAKMIKKVKEVLLRVAIGISNNKSLKGTQLFPFVYATIHPFIGSEAIATIEQDQHLNDDNDGDNNMSIKISGRKKLESSSNSNLAQAAASVVEWRPSTMHSAGSNKSAVTMKKNEIHELRKVQDGKSAPKLTGTSRHNLLETFDIRTINEPATITAIIFGLNLMNACLKKLDIRDDKSLDMLNPFVPMLTACVCHCRETDVVLVALKCLLVLLRSNLSSIPSCSKSIGSKTLTLLTVAGSSLSTNHDLTQACFKTLTHLIGTKTKSQAGDERTTTSSLSKTDDECGIEGGLPLNAEQMKVLISLIQASITDTDQHNPALNLIKVILMRRFMSPELYDLMESLMKLVVRSPKTLLRQVRLFLWIVIQNFKVLPLTTFRLLPPRNVQGFLSDIY